MNYFDLQNAAERYSKGRPDFHKNTITVIKFFLHLEHKLDKALDIACGTGLSTKALLEISENVYGTDSSLEMLKFALQRDKIKYLVASAESQPFLDNEFDLVTVSSGVHWFDVDKFLVEAHRILKSNSWLILYDNYFISEMQGVSEFNNWFPEIYLKKFPSPARNNKYEWTNENLEPKKLILRKEETFKNKIQFTKEELIQYFLTQSNIISALEISQMEIHEIENWLNKELSIFFSLGDERRIINFGNWIKFIQRMN